MNTIEHKKTKQRKSENTTDGLCDERVMNQKNILLDIAFSSVCPVLCVETLEVDVMKMGSFEIVFLTTQNLLAQREVNQLSKRDQRHNWALQHRTAERSRHTP